MFTVYFRFAANSPAGSERSALLERLLARAQPGVEAPDWRADALRIIAGADASLAPASAALSVLAAPAAVGALGARPAPAPPQAAGAIGEWVFVATPVHLIAGPRGVHLPADGVLALEDAEVWSLVGDFNRVFGGDGIRLHAGRGRLLLCTVPSPMRAATRAPEELAGRDVLDFMPQGPDAGAVRRLMTEMQMWLHEHALNEDRAARAAPPISALWLWGAGSTRAPLPALQGWAAGEDPLFGALGAHARYPGAVGSGVIVVAHGPQSPGWGDTEERWLAPAAADLKAGRLGRLLLSAAGRRFELSPRAARRFWRRTRPWQAYFREAPESRASAFS